MLTASNALCCQSLTQFLFLHLNIFTSSFLLTTVVKRSVTGPSETAYYFRFPQNGEKLDFKYRTSYVRGWTSGCLILAQPWEIIFLLQTNITLIRISAGKRITILWSTSMLHASLSFFIRLCWLTLFSSPQNSTVTRVTAERTERAQVPNEHQQSRHMFPPLIHPPDRGRSFPRFTERVSVIKRAGKMQDVILMRPICLLPTVNCIPSVWGEPQVDFRGNTASY